MFKSTTLIIFWFTSFLCCAQVNVVSNLKIQGNEKLKTTFIKNISAIKSGEVLDSLLIEQDVLRLKRLPSVSHANFQVVLTKNNEYDVIYFIEENFTLIPSLNIYTTNNGEFAYRAGLYEFNTFGKNITFGGFYQHDNFSSYALNVRAPYLFSNKFGLAVNAQNLSTLEPVFFDNTSANYRYNNKSFEVLGLYEINFSNRLEVGVNYFVEDYEYKFGATNPNVPQVFKVNKRLLKAIYEYNNLDYNYYQVSGFRSQLNFQYVTAPVDKISDFLIGWNDFFLFKRIGERGNWANRMRVGLSTNDETPFAPFSVDNNINVRGVGNIIDRGTGTIVINTEYRQTLYEKSWFVLQGNAFVDAGTWRNPGGDLNDFAKKENIRVYPGLGLRFIHKKIFNAIFRIDYGYGITPDATQGFVFGIGQYF